MGSKKLVVVKRSRRVRKNLELMASEMLVLIDQINKGVVRDEEVKNILTKLVTIYNEDIVCEKSSLLNLSLAVGSGNEGFNNSNDTVKHASIKLVRKR